MRSQERVHQTAGWRLGSQVEQLEYIRAIVRELRDMTAAERFEMLTFQLEMAYLEASDQLRELHAQSASGALAEDPDTKKAPPRHGGKS